MATIFIDEAGHTGSNLLDPVQPVFILATHDFEEPEARKIKADFFGSCNANSLKFSQLSRRPKGQDAIIAFLGAMLPTFSNRFKTHAIHKPFAVMCKLVDHIVETSLRHSGVDLYKNGENLSLSNALYLFTESLAGKDYLRRVLAGTQRLFTSETLSACELVWILEEQTGLIYGPRRSGPLAKFLAIPQDALLDLDHRFIASRAKDDILISFPTALLVMSDWGQRHGGDLHVIHDQSSEMLHQFDEWARFTAPSIPKTIVGMDRRTIHYPIGVQSTRFETDEDWAGLQLADIVAGSLFKALSCADGLALTAPDSFAKRLVEIANIWPLVGSVWPEAKFSPDELGTSGPKYGDPFDFYRRVMGA